MKPVLSCTLSTLACVAMITASSAARAQTPPALAAQPANASDSPEADVVPPGTVDVTLQEAAPPRRYLAIEWNPLPFVAMHTGVKPDPGGPTQGGLGKLSLNFVLAPLEHHALILSPYYVLTRTTPITVFDDNSNPTQLPVQTFRGYGAELGYRYYTGQGGLRGFFAGPSLILATMTATAQNGQKTPYLDYGVAVDVGYQALVVDSVSLSIGAGLQYTTPSKNIPEQMLWAKVFANAAVFPRVLVSVGWAL